MEGGAMPRRDLRMAYALRPELHAVFGVQRFLLSVVLKDT